MWTPVEGWRLNRAAPTALAFAIACAAGCGTSAPSPREHAGSSANAIQGGTLDTTHTFAIGICGGAYGGPMSGANCQLVCSGALVAPNLVISARHCVDNVSSDTVMCGVDMFGSPLFPASAYWVTTDSDMFNPSALWFEVSEVITPTDTAFCGNDLSLLILDKNVPSSVVPAFVTPEISAPMYSPQFSLKETAIGYGLDSPTDTTSAGYRRILENIPIACIPGDPNAAYACGPVGVSGVGANEFEAGNGVCEGDSGSSAYDQTGFDSGKLVSFGVLSRGGVSGNTCVGSIYTQLYGQRDLIITTAQQAAMAGGYPVPEWASAMPDGGPPPDSGTTHDAGSTGKKPPGASCTSGSVCESGDCVALSVDTGSVCADPCSKGHACRSGFTCQEGYCFRGAGPDAGSGSGGTSGQSGGCAVAGPSSGRLSPWPWVLGACLVATRRRRRTR